MSTASPSPPPTGGAGWRKRFRGWLNEIAAVHPPREGVDLDAMADMVSTVVDGGIIISRAMDEPKVVAQQIMLYRSFVEMAFEPQPTR